MKNIRGTIFLILTVSMGLVAQEKPDTKEIRSAELVAAWTIDLRPTPSAPDYYQSFTVAEVSGNTFTGSFYGSAIENG